MCHRRNSRFLQLGGRDALRSEAHVQAVLDSKVITILGQSHPRRAASNIEPNSLQPLDPKAQPDIDSIAAVPLDDIDSVPAEPQAAAEGRLVASAVYMNVPIRKHADRKGAWSQANCRADARSGISKRNSIDHPTSS
jgi:hypothetical protein